jgi:hypothetical protein
MMAKVAIAAIAAIIMEIMEIMAILVKILLSPCSRTFWPIILTKVDEQQKYTTSLLVVQLYK